MLSGTIKAKLTPIKIGRPEPRRQTGVACIKVAMPAAIMAFWTRTRTISCGIFGEATAVTTVIGTRFVTNMARICCREKGITLNRLTFPFSS